MNRADLRREIGDDEPVLLSAAVDLFFAPGMMKLSTLRTEARKGRLATSRVAGKDYVTRSAVKDMFERCRVERSRPASKSAPSQTDEESGSSETASGIDGQDALRRKLAKLKNGSATISRKNAGPTRPNVVRLRSSSATS